MRFTIISTELDLAVQVVLFDCLSWYIIVSEIDTEIPVLDHLINFVWDEDIIFKTPYCAGSLQSSPHHQAMFPSTTGRKLSFEYSSIPFFTHTRIRAVRLPTSRAVPRWCPRHGHALLRGTFKAEPPGPDGSVRGVELIFPRTLCTCYSTM